MYTVELWMWRTWRTLKDLKNSLLATCLDEMPLIL